MRPVLGTFLFGFAFCLSFLLSSCSGGRETTKDYADEMTGMASYYADEFDGRKTSNGEVYDMHALTAAHPSLPFNSRVRVTNLDNNRSVVVRINDRGPFKGGRIIDVSYRAALELGMIQNGTAPVRIEVLELGPTAAQ